jgi:hypothetical protein
MSNVQQYNLWFVNQSSSAGQVCIYQDNGNVTFNQPAPTVLAWMLTSANPSVQVNFKWATDYNFAWFDYDSPRKQQIIGANLNTGNSVTFSLNQYGYYFQTPATIGSSGQLSVQSDGSIPAVNNAVAGIGMHGAGTFAFPAKPNINSIFTPVQDVNLVYWISFGYYSFDVNDRINFSILNKPAKISFPYGVYTMTAILNVQNLWTIHQGQPVTANAKQVLQVTVYEAGKGVLS